MWESNAGVTQGDARSLDYRNSKLLFPHGHHGACFSYIFSLDLLDPESMSANYLEMNPRVLAGPKSSMT